MLTAKTIQCLRNFFIPFFLLVSIIGHAQTPGLIVRPAGGPYNVVLDKNSDGFTSPTNSGFVTTDVGAGNSEIPYKIVPPFKLEPTSDLMRGPNTLFSDLVRISNDESGMYIFNDGTNMLFRLRLGSIVSGSKGYSILIDADGLFGASGTYADPNYKPMTTGINGNPGFELEVVLETNFRVAIYDVDGKDDAGTTAYKTYPINTNSQISIAYSTVSDNPDYLYDFYVPIADLKYASGTKSVTASTPIRVSATTVMSPQASIGGPKSDIYGYDGTDYMKAWETIVNGQPAFTPNDVLSTGSGITNKICTAAPTLNSPISAGTVAISGTWTQADVTRPSSATITLFKNGVAWPTTTTISTGGIWSISGVTAASGDVFYAKAQSSGDSACLQSNSVTALGCLPSNMSSVSNITLTCASDRGFDGTAPANAVVRVYTVTSAGYTLYADESSTSYKITRPGSTTRWIYDNVNTNSTNPCTGGSVDVPIAQYAVTIQEPGKCESDYYYFHNNNSCASTTATPLITQTALYTGNTTVSGTATTGATVRLFVNGQFKLTTTAAGGVYSFITTSLATGDVVDVYAQASGSCISAKTTRTVVCFTAPPIITTTNTGNLVNGAMISGTSTEATGTTIRLYNSANALLGTVTVQSGGTWTTSVAAVTGTSYYATAQSATCGVSTASATVSALAATTTCATITGTYNDASTVVSGTLDASFTGTVRLYQDGVLAGSTSVSGATNWTITPTANTLYPGGVLTVTTQSSTGAEKTNCSSSSVTISCAAPTSPSVSYTTVTLGSSSGVSVFTLASSQQGVLYTLEDLSGVDKGTSVFGSTTSGYITLNSYSFLTPGTYNLRISALKLSGSNCGTSATTVTLIVTDNDGDGVSDPVDIDDDNDGILDVNETASGDATGDADSDGIPNYKDANFCTLNSNNVCANLDQDGDGIINQFDLDADNDGIPDIVENGGVDSNNDGLVDVSGTADTDLDGLRNAVDATPSGGAPGSNGLSNQDFDGDGIPNYKDLDSDGDGILDSRESGLNQDTNNNGLVSDEVGYVGGTDGWSNAVDAFSGPLTVRNTDGGTQADYLDIDSDNDGIIDIIEAQTTVGYLAPVGADSDGDGIDNQYDNNDASFGGNINNGNAPVNTDGTDLADYLDGDSDNDGYPDSIEGHDTNGDNIPDTGSPAANGVGGSADVDSDGLLDGFDNNFSNNASTRLSTNGTSASDYPNVDGGTTEKDWREAANTDTDGLTNLLDIDDDNDGITDLIENGGVDALGDADSDGVYNYLDQSPGSGVFAFADANSDGINDAFDKDRDGVINSLDLDSDNDGITDLIEAGGVDTNGDGQVDVLTDTDGDGLADKYDTNNGGVTLSNLDTDGDGIPNSQDLDSDNDGIADVIEAGGTDANNDGRLDANALAGWDSNGDGFADAVSGSSSALIITGSDANNDGKPDSYPKANLDATGLPNPYDLDSDGDGIVDTREANVTDVDGNGIVDGVSYGGTDTNGWSNLVDGTSGGTSLSIPNTDASGNANYLDIDSDNDGITDNVEGQATASYQPPTASDSDGDGIDNQYDNYAGFGGTGIVPVNTDLTDSPDYLDSNSDNDIDTDIIEGNDFNGNGKADDNVTLSGNDTDGDGLDDIFESSVANGPIVTIAGFGGAGGKSPAQKTPTATSERDWRNSNFVLSTSNVLPVHFVSISATKQNNGVQVVWTVSDEQNVKNYEVEKSTNGSRYAKIGEVPFSASSNSINKYQFYDASPIGSTVYYRIRQVDHDGKFMFSSVVFVGANESGSKLTVHPNPVLSEASIVLGVKSNQKTMLVVCDMQGRIMARTNVEIQKGQNVIPAESFKKLPGGTYILMAEADGILLQTRFVK